MHESNKPKKESKWRTEDSEILETLKKSNLQVSRIVYDEDCPPKRCISFEKNKKRVAFDLEMVPAVLVVLKKLCPDHLLPKELRS